MNLLNTRYPWRLELLTKEIIDHKVESEQIIEGALIILSPKYIECMKLFNKYPENKIIRHNYFLLSTLYELLVLESKKSNKQYEYYEIRRSK